MVDPLLVMKLRERLFQFSTTKRMAFGGVGQ